jgi:hypothetical protein
MRASSPAAIMTPDLAKRLALVFPSAAIHETGVTGVAGVADVTRYAQNPLQIRQLRPLRLEGDDAGKTTIEGVAEHVAPPAAPDIDAFEEGAALVGGDAPSAAEDREEASTNPEIVGLLHDKRREVVRWINDHFESSPPGVCGHCLGVSRPADPFVTLFVGEDRADIHASCYLPWLTEKEAQARIALATSAA